MIETLLVVIAAYLAAGLIFALVFHAFGLRRVDPGVAGAGVLFRLLVTPGLATLWPWLAVRWRRALAGGDPAGSAEAPVKPRGLRAGHRRLVWVLLLVVPALALLAWVRRPPPAPPSPAPQLFEALAGAAGAGEVVERIDRPFGELPLSLELRSGEDGARNLRLHVAEDLELPALGLYFAAKGAGAAAEGAAGGLPAGSVFLGAVYGPAELGYTLPAGADGSLWLYSLAHGEVVSHHVLGDGR